MSALATAVTNTILLCTLTCLFAVPIGTFLAVFLSRTDVKARSAAWIFLGSQIALPLYVFAGGWCAALGTQGWLPAIGPDWLQTTQSTGTVVTVALVHGLASTPWVSFLISLGLTHSERSLEETAQLESGWTATLRDTVLPRLQVWVLASCLFCCLPVLTEMVVTNLFQVPSVAERIYLDASLGTVTPVTYVAATLFCILPVLLAGGLWLWVSPPWSEVAFRATHFPAGMISLGPARYAMSAAVWMLVLGLVVVPIASLVVKAGWRAETLPDGSARYGWDVQRLVQTAIEGFTEFGHEFYWSSQIAIASTCIASACAWLLLWLSGGRWRARAIVSVVMLLLVSIPGPAVGMLVIALMNRGEPAWVGYLYDATIAAPVLSQQFRLLPYAWVIAITISATIAQSTREQLQLDGFRPGLRFAWQLLPQVWRKLAAAWIILAVLSVGELSCSLLVLPPGMTTLSKRLFEMLHFGMRHRDSALCGVLIVLGWVVSFVLRKTLSDRRRPS